MTKCDFTVRAVKLYGAPQYTYSVPLVVRNGDVSPMHKGEKIAACYLEEPKVSFDAATCILTIGTQTVQLVCPPPLLPCILPSITTDPDCNFVITGDTWKNNAGVPEFKIVTGNPPVGFTNLDNNAGAQITIVSVFPQVKCGISFTIPVSNNAGAILGYGATL